MRRVFNDPSFFVFCLMIQLLTDVFVRFIFPRMCAVCALPIERFALGASCESCWNETRLLTGEEPSCSKCGALLDGSSLSAKETADTRCGRCENHGYDKVLAVGLYKKALRAEILNLKSESFLGAHAAALLVEASRRVLSPVDVVVPVPLAKRRLKERGFNQAELLGKEICRARGLTFSSKTLKRVTHTPMHRAGMDSKAREATVRKAFVVEDASAVEGRNVLLIDDVFTSGATTSQCAKVLKEAGSLSVNVLTLARTK